MSRELAAATLRALRDSYHELNRMRFGDALSPPSFRLGQSVDRLGSWDPSLRCIEISERLLLERGWGEAMEVLAHEMAHQFVHEQMPEVDEPAHGPAFQRVCQQRGIDASARGEPARGGPSHPVLDRVRKLLSLAQSSNEHEAQSAARVAQRLMLRHNIDQLSAQRADGYTHRQLGRTTGRTTEAERILGSLLQDHFFVDVIWVYGFRPRDGKYGRVMEVCGRRENVELADYVHEFVTRTAERLWQTHRRAKRLRGNRERQSYLAGVMAGFREQLEAQKKQQAGRGLIWRGDPALHAYFARRHPSVSTRRYYEGSAAPAREHGRRAGRGIVLHRGVRSRADDAAPRKLPAPR